MKIGEPFHWTAMRDGALMNKQQPSDDLLNVVRETSDALIRCRTLSEAFSTCSEYINRTNNWDEVSVALFKESFLSFPHGDDGDPIPLTRRCFSDEINRRLSDGLSVFTSDSEMIDFRQPLEPGRIIPARGILPIVIGQKVAGVVQVNSKTPDSIPPAVQNALILITRELSSALAKFNLRDRGRTAGRDPEGGPADFVGIIRDSTQEKYLEKELVETQAALRMLVDTNPVSFFLMDPSGHILTANQKLADTLDLPLDDIIGKNAFDLVPEDVGRLRRKRIQNALDTKQPQFFEDERGSRFWENQLYPILDDQGHVTFLAVMANDLTERRERENLVNKLTERLKQAQKLEVMGSLASGIAHDFKNILWAIIGFGEMTLKEMPEGTSGHENIVSLLKASTRAKELVEQILTYSRQADMLKKHTSLRIIVKDLINFIGQTFPPSVIVQQNITDDPCIILANVTQIHQLLLNICVNAKQALINDCGCIGLTLARVCLLPGHHDGDNEASNQEYACMTISDSGTGMDDEVLKRIFYPFFTTKSTGEGTGLGLSLAHGIIFNHWGFIEAESRLGQGTVFKIYLPLSEGTAEVPETELNSMPQGNERILFVDDELILVQMFSRLLGKLGYEVIGRTDPRAAYSDFENDPDGFDLVIVDYIMPGMNGLELGRRIKALRPDIPIILCTGNTQYLELEPDDESVIDYIMEKPVFAYQTAVIIRRALDEGV